MRIILADHHEQPRFALRMLLDAHTEFDLIGEAVDAQGLLALAKKHPSDLVLLDGGLPGIDTKDLIARLHGFEPRPIVIAMSDRLECSGLMLKAGADAFVSKGQQPDWLLDKLQKYTRSVDH